jgi:hypothetical protein
MICHFCKARFAFADDLGEPRSDEDRKKEMDSDDEAVCADCDKKFQG